MYFLRKTLYKPCTFSYSADMKKVIPVYKPVGLTPLQAIQQYKKNFPEYQNQILSYAGRLDPMAKGLLLLLVGEENKNREQYLNLQKTYEFKVLLGIATDTYDILGHITNIKPPSQDIQQLITPILKNYKGPYIQAFPPYSSAPVNGKPLFYWAREGKLNEIKIPQKEITVSKLILQQVEMMHKTQLEKVIFQNLKKIKGDFRQESIIVSWQEFFLKSTTINFPVASFNIVCSSGTYVRSIAHNIGKDLGSFGLALQIKRIKIGNFLLKDAVILKNSE